MADLALDAAVVAYIRDGNFRYLHTAEGRAQRQKQFDDLKSSIELHIAFLDTHLSALSET